MRVQGSGFRVQERGAKATDARQLTAHGRGAIAVIRVSGKNSWDVVGRYVRMKRGAFSSPPLDDRLFLGEWVDEAGTVDDVMICAGHSADGHLHMDISTHGGTRVVQRVMLDLEKAGVGCLAQGGSSWDAENRIQTEADQWIQRASTRRGALFLARQREILPRALRALEDSSLSSRDVETALKDMLDRAEAGRRLVEGASIVVVGPVNAGKSTLANRLVGAPGSLVSPEPGTTRDWVSNTTALNGIPLTVYDTAGLRDTSDSLESMAMERAGPVVRQADACLIVLDRSQDCSSDTAGRLRTVIGGRHSLLVINKIDLTGPQECLPALWPGVRRTVEVSALTGQGFPELNAVLEEVLGLNDFDDRAPTPFTARQARCMDDYLDGGVGPDVQGRAVWVSSILREC